MVPGSVVAGGYGSKRSLKTRARSTSSWITTDGFSASTAARSNCSAFGMLCCRITVRLKSSARKPRSAILNESPNTTAFGRRGSPFEYAAGS